MDLNRKIAVIVTELLKDFTDSILKKFSDRFSYRIFTYHVFEDIPQIAQQITEEFDGILTSGSFPAHMLKLSCPTERRPVAFFNTDDAALFRLLLKLLMITAIIVSSIAMNRVSKQETVNALICVSLSTPETYS